ncbi:hypothetical protein [Flexithrix dorotheae]|nr:hypothetical protein [Flexithrix dorotheae]
MKKFMLITFTCAVCTTWLYYEGITLGWQVGAFITFFFNLMTLIKKAQA